MITRDTNAGIIQKTEKRNSHSSPSPIAPLSFKLNQLISNPAFIASLMQTSGPESPMSTGVFVKVDSRYKKINTQDIYLIEALCDYVNIYTKEKRYTIHSTLYHILDKLPHADYIRIHRSYIVRMDSVTAIEDHYLYIEEKQVPIGKTFKDEVMSRFNVFS